MMHRSLFFYKYFLLAKEITPVNILYLLEKFILHILFRLLHVFYKLKEEEEYKKMYTVCVWSFTKIARASYYLALMKKTGHSSY
jgi:hypothetical protein